MVAPGIISRRRTPRVAHHYWILANLAVLGHLRGQLFINLRVSSRYFVQCFRVMISLCNAALKFALLG
jgi:hypothetical protein